MTSRLLKQITVLLIITILVIVIGFGISRVISNPTPTQTIDLRTLLDPIEILSVDVLEVRPNDYDLLVKVRNPNTEYGSEKVIYTINLADAFDNNVGTYINNFYILPGQTKYIVAQGVPTSGTVGNSNMIITNITWQKLDVLGKAGVKLIVTNFDYYIRKENHIFSSVEGRVLNNSDFDVNEVDVIIIARDKIGRALAVQRSSIKTFLSKSLRGFEVLWFQPFEGEVTSVDVEAETNVFLNDNFIKSYGSYGR